MFWNKQSTPETPDALLKELLDESRPEHYKLNLRYTFSQKISAKSPEEQRDFVLAAVEWLKHAKPVAGDYGPWTVRTRMLDLLTNRLPLVHDHIVTLLDWSARQSNNYEGGVPHMIKVVADYLKGHERTPVLEEKIGKLAAKIASGYSTTDSRKWVVRLRELGGQSRLQMPLEEGEAWADAAITDIRALEDAHSTAWLELLNACLKASSSAPTAKWLKTIAPPFEQVGFQAFKQAVLKWFPLVDKPRTEPITSWSQYEPDPNLRIQAINADILKGLVWLCAQHEDREIARALTALAVSAYRKVPGIGPRCVRVGNACVWALGNMPGSVATGQLALLKVKVKFGTAQKGIESALSTAAARIGLPQDEIEEMSVPNYGLQEVGVGREQLGDFTAELVVTGTGTAELRWSRADGKRQASVPQWVKENHAEELKELNAAVKDIRKMLPAQRDRIENLYLDQKKWSVPVWRERYLDHPLIGTLARRLIWKFTNGEQTASAAWLDGRLVGSDGRSLAEPDDSTLVELWHPIEETTDAVLAWRDWLSEHEIRQPFKQAHRELYLLTDAERETRLYSNRFAAHLLKQHQFNALCAVRGWKNKLRLMVDDEVPPATRMLGPWGLRAEFWVEGVGDNYGTDTTDSGTFLYLTTDQVRFYSIEAAQNFAHASGGGYHVGGYGRVTATEPLPLEQLPPLVFSEIMRDVDMFVGVASIANDPNWSDGGPEGRYRNYWADYSFGNLSETAKTRGAVLERLIPRLKIAERCRLSEKFLIVRGDVRTYKIHLGSGNILMEPNDQYLCIVAARGAGEAFAGKVFLPFEGDATLALILSKAFLLAEDTKIKDPTILQQIAR
jgi:hypothetical protein